MIKGSFFKDISEKWFNNLELNSIYLISNGKIVNRNEIYNKINFPYEIIFDINSNFNIVNDNSLNSLNFNFIKIIDIKNLNLNEKIDIIGLVKEIKPIKTVVTKKNQIISLKNIIIFDDSNSNLEISLWGEEAEKFDCNLFDVICLKNPKINFFKNEIKISISLNFLILNPEISETIFLKNWWKNNIYK